MNWPSVYRRPKTSALRSWHGEFTELGGVRSDSRVDCTLPVPQLA